MSQRKESSFADVLFFKRSVCRSAFLGEEASSDVGVVLRLFKEATMKLSAAVVALAAVGGASAFSTSRGDLRRLGQKTMPTTEPVVKSKLPLKMEGA